MAICDNYEAQVELDIWLVIRPMQLLPDCEDYAIQVEPNIWLMMMTLTLLAD
jgi:hypothetical protein